MMDWALAGSMYKVLRGTIMHARWRVRYQVACRQLCQVAQLRSLGDAQPQVC